MFSYLLFGITYAFAAAVQPGPFQTYIISQAIRNGWKRTLPASFSPLISDGPIIILVLFILSRLPVWAVQFLHFGGALFLFYLAANAFNSWRNYDSKSVTVAQPGHQTLLKAAFVNILNPAPYLGWSLVMGPLFIKGYRETPVYGIILLISFYVTMIVCLSLIIILFSSARKLGASVNRMILGISVLALVGFGLYQLWLGAWIFFTISN